MKKKMYLLSLLCLLSMGSASPLFKLLKTGLSREYYKRKCPPGLKDSSEFKDLPDLEVEQQEQSSGKVNFVEKLPAELSGIIFDFYSNDCGKIRKNLLPVCKDFGEAVKYLGGLPLKVKFSKKLFKQPRFLFLKKKDKNNKKLKERLQAIKKYVGKERQICLDCSAAAENLTIGQLSAVMEVFKGRNVVGLNLDGCCQMNDEAVTAITKNLKGLCELNLKGCYKIKDDGLGKLIESCPNLQKLNLELPFLITNEYIEQLAKKYPDLKIITTRLCVTTRLSGRALFWKGMYVCYPNLNFEGTDITDEQLNVIAEVFKDCKIRGLNLKGCKKLSNPDLTGFPWLTKLCLGETNVKDTAIKKILPKATVLDLSGCKNLVRPDFSGLINLCELSLSNTNIAGDVIATITGKMFKLKKLNLSATNITNAALKTLPGWIKKLNLERCFKVTDDCVNQLNAKYKKLEIIR